MIRNQRRFPLVADGEPVSNPPKVMALYENEDLITNIHGAYQDKSYDDVTRDYNFVGKDEQDASRIESVTQGKSYAELAREEARRDIRRKRQDYLSKEVKAPSKAALQQQLKATLPKKTAKPTSSLSYLAEKLHQDDYILAEIPVTYKKPDNSSTIKPKKNNYDFLKESQIYNKEVLQSQREHKVAQELNLTRFDDAK
ncbi:hypothetical protein KJR23_01850 [Streptococcus lutetiensis]|uniref:hypothetical protein n=1 Tax=Streptococcus lutetiensis TaxID=150055 RepID=UPI001BDA8E0C|nr:hypothetical protein [Streptococcus lutetiensis]MBT0901415.1 hypothetical protein [Streptococcus lutetiensis]